jgi:hypothetical protein
MIKGDRRTMTLIARKPSQALVDIVGALGGRWSGYTALCRCPAHADRAPSLSLRQGDSGILVTCFAGCEPAAVLSELRKVGRGPHFPPPRDEGLRTTASVERLWREAVETTGTLGERYLQRRSLPGVLPDVRFHPRCPSGPRPRTVFRPALLVAVREGARPVALQRIFLNRETAWHEAKMMLGAPGRGSWQGAAAGAVLAIAEGFETAAAFTRLHGIACWAALGARRLDRLAIPPCVRTLIIAEDNDPEGRRAARKAWARYQADGLTMWRMPPPDGADDWAEVLEGRLKREGGPGR